MTLRVLNTFLRLISVVIALIVVVELLPGCDSTNKGTGPSVVDADRPVQRFEYHSGEQLEKLVDSLNYTPETWAAGVREVPRLYITNVPQRWRDKTSIEVDTVTKKRIFFRLLGPLVLRANEMILADRQRAESIIDTLRAGDTIAPPDEAFLRETAVAYKLVDTGPGIDINDRAVQDELLQRVDTLPPSLVLAQAAEESGWGASRFAVEGNSLFGMWTWNDKGIKPKQQRAELGNYKIASHESPLESVSAYMRNLNTSRSYEALRQRRAEFRRAGKKVTGWDLAGTLTSYSERGKAYVDSLHALMKTNMLEPTDDAYLGDGPTILLIPVGEGV